MTDEKKFVLGEMHLTPASETRERAETAMPGTSEIKPILVLVPPPLDMELVRPLHEDVEQDYGPDPVAEFALTAPATAVFSPQVIADALTPDLRRLFGRPTFYVRTPGGRTTYAISSEAPTEAVALIAGWTLREDCEPDNAAAGAEALGKWLSSRPEGFSEWRVDQVALQRQRVRARRILSVKPDSVSIDVWPRTPDERFDGKTLWRTLHAVGLRWGDMDQFHWSDPTDQTDYLFSAEVDDGQFGYALPEEIAAGRQHFDVVSFGFNVPRTPHPAHVLQQMILAAQAAARELEAELAPSVDDEPVDRIEDLAVAVQSVVEQLAALDVKPGSHSVCMLR